MAKGYLPKKGSPRALEIIELYPTASSEQLDEWISEFGYSNRNTFTDSVYRTYGIRRGKTVGEQIEKRKMERGETLKLSTGQGFKTMAVINDLQIPYHDEKTLSLAEVFLQELQPDYLIYNGDIHDFYPISHFDRDPSRMDCLQSDLTKAKVIQARHRKILPNTRILENDGNHEDRLRRFLWTKAPALESLDCLQMEKLLGSDELEIERVPAECGIMVNGIFMVIHGEIASVHSGYTAKRMYEKHGGCGICGHCHRGGSYYKRDRFGIWGWWENFCLCDLNPDWINNPNWVQGFSLVHFLGKRFWVEQIPIIDHTLMYGGKLYD